MNYTARNSMLQVRRLDQLQVSCAGRRTLFSNFH